MRTYLDHAASSPLRPAARAAMENALDIFANPSSIHAEGQAAKTILDDTRRTLADMLEIRAERIIFTSGGTESNNLAIRGLMAAMPGKQVLCGATEHPCVLQTTLGLAGQVIPVHANGQLNLSALETRLKQGNVGLVSVMHANNESGVLNPVADIASLCHRHGALFHTDAVQSAGHTDIRPDTTSADLMTLSAHKLGGPRGVGVLVVKPELPFTAQLTGGSQERNRRSGTENTLALAGFKATLEDITAHHAEESARLTALQTQLHTGLKSLPGVTLVGENAPRVPHITQVIVEGKKGEDMVIALDLMGIAGSQGSACGSGRTQSSTVLLAMGYTPTQAGSALRISTGWNSTAEDISNFLTAFAKVVA